MTDFKGLNKIVIDDFESFNSCYSLGGLSGGLLRERRQLLEGHGWHVGKPEAALGRDQRDP